jgi:hypothetical protein
MKQVVCEVRYRQPGSQPCSSHSTGRSPQDDICPVEVDPCVRQTDQETGVPPDTHRSSTAENETESRHGASFQQSPLPNRVRSRPLNGIRYSLDVTQNFFDHVA